MTNPVALCPAADATAHQRPGSSKVLGGRIPVLDGLRGFAILAVMLYHFHQGGPGEGSAWESVYAAIAGSGWTGVNLFFVLSGFLITGILYDSRQNQHYYRIFYGRRTVRIFPLYYAFLAVYFIAVPAMRRSFHDQDLVDLSGTTAEFCTWSYTLNWLIGFKGFTVVPALIQHFWSLSIEEQFYIFWPLVVRSVSRRRLMQLCAGLTVVALALRCILALRHMPDAAYTWTCCRADSMAIGALIALALRDPGDARILQRMAWPAAMAALAGGLVLIAFNGGTYNGTFLMDGPGILLTTIFFGALLVLCVHSHPASLLRRLSSGAFLRFMGKYSYAIYLFHQPLAIVLRRAGVSAAHLAVVLHGKIAGVAAVNAIDFSVSIALAFASWHCFEKQFLKLKDLPWLRYRAG